MKKLFWVIVAIVLVVAIIAASHKDTKISVIHKYNGTLVALGDSVAAGDGLKTDSDSSACNRTDESYPSLLAKKKNFKLNNLACSGATTEQGITGKQEVNKLLVTPQLEQLFAIKNPSLITITIGANDAGWTEILGKCYTSTCGTEEDMALVAERLDTLQTNLTAVLKQIADHYKTSPPHVVVTGYYQVFPASATCNELSGIDATEQEQGRQLQQNISNVVQQAVEGVANAQFVPLDFSGHELCSADPWVQGLEGSAPYHPTADGQAHIATQIEAALPKGKRND